MQAVALTALPLPEQEMLLFRLAQRAVMASEKEPQNGVAAECATYEHTVCWCNLTVDCSGFGAVGTPESCDIFCFATMCMGLPDTLHHEHSKDVINRNRKDSGADNQPFSDAGIAKYGTWRRGNDYTWGDEYPLASSSEGGNGVKGSGRAILQGAREKEQRGQSNWANLLWDDSGAATITLEVMNYSNDVKTGSPAYRY